MALENQARETITALREQRERISELEKENKSVFCGRHKHRVALFCGDCLEEIRRDFDLVERQLAAALEALVVLNQTATIERIQGMK